MSMPNSATAEWAIIGSVLYDNRALKYCEGVTPEHFYTERNGDIWRAIRDVEGRGIAIDESSMLDCFGSESGVADYVEHALIGFEVASQVHILTNCYQRRCLIEAADRVRSAAHNTDGAFIDAGEVLSEHDADLDAVRAMVVGNPDDEWCRVTNSIVTVLDEVRESIVSGRERGLLTGIHNLDSFTGGFKPGDLVILAGASSMGKTCVAQNIAMGAALRGKRVAFFSQEMNVEQLSMRTASREARRRGIAEVSYRDIDNGTVTIPQLDALEGVYNGIPETLVVNTDSMITPAQVRSKSRLAQKMLGGLDLIVVDYLQIMSIFVDRGDNRAAAVGKVTAALKAIGKELNCPVLVLSQLARLKGREDKRPTLDDLRDSGSIEQDADKVIFVYREHYYIKRAEPEMTDADHDQWRVDEREARHRIELNVAKNRMGRVGRVDLWIDIGCDLVLSSASELQGAEILDIRGQA